MNDEGKAEGIIFQDRPYGHDQYVEREELRLIRDKVEYARYGNPIREPVMNIWGEGGIGKSWFLNHIRETFAFLTAAGAEHPQEKQPFTLYFKFVTGANLHTMVQTLARQIQEQLGEESTKQVKHALEAAIQTGEIAPFVDTLRGLMEPADRATGLSFIPILLLDDADQLNAEDLAVIEQQIVEPLALTEGALIILTGRNRVARWNRFEVRRKLMPTEQTHLNPFTKEQIRQLIKSFQSSAPLDEIHKYSAGNPQLAAEMISRAAMWGKEEEESEKSWRRNHQKVLDLLQEFEDHLLEGIKDDLKLILLTIFPLRFYRMEALHSMLNPKKEASKSQPDIYYLRILRRFDAETNVVWWDFQHRAYVTSPVIRQLIDRKTQLKSRIKQSSDYVDAHLSAYHMYEELADQARHISEDYLIEMLYHMACLYAADEDKASLTTRLEYVLNFAQANLAAEHLLILQQQFAGDHELRDLLPETEVALFSRKLEEQLQEKSSQLVVK